MHVPHADMKEVVKLARAADADKQLQAAESILEAIARDGDAHALSEDEARTLLYLANARAPQVVLQAAAALAHSCANGARVCATVRNC